MVQKMRKLIFLFIVFVSILVTACSEISNSKSSEGIVCDSPYIRFEEGCCLDNNDNKICDEDDIEEESDKEKVTSQVTFTNVGYCNSYDDCFAKVIGSTLQDIEQDPSIDSELITFMKQQVRCRENICEASDALLETWSGSLNENLEE